jgi:hypothetical protein
LGGAGGEKTGDGWVEGEKEEIGMIMKWRKLI